MFDCPSRMHSEFRNTLYSLLKRFQCIKCRILTIYLCQPYGIAHPPYSDQNEEVNELVTVRLPQEECSAHTQVSCCSNQEKRHPWNVLHQPASEERHTRIDHSIADEYQSYIVYTPCTCNKGLWRDILIF